MQSKRDKRQRRRPRLDITTVRQALAWSAHLYTAMGLVLAAMIAVLIVRGDPASIRWAFVLMFVATIVDATDGTWARRVRVKEVLPNFDGRRLDDIIDFLTYTFLPLFLLWRTDDLILPAGQGWWLLFPLIASAYGFCQVSAKTDDGYFLGFPSYWNLVVFYLYVLQPPGWLSVALLVVLAMLTFVPSLYLYPTQRGRLNLITNMLGAIWAGFMAWILFLLPSETTAIDSGLRHLAVISLYFPAFYMAASWAVTLKLWKAKRRGPEELPEAARI